MNWSGVLVYSSWPSPATKKSTTKHQRLWSGTRLYRSVWCFRPTEYLAKIVANANMFNNFVDSFFERITIKLGLLSFGCI